MAKKTAGAAGKKTKKIYGLTAIGNALVDVLAYTDEAFIMAQESKGMKKGAMILIDKPRSKEIYGLIENPQQMSGGSAANTLSGFASFGGKGAFIGKTAEDKFGKIFRADLARQGLAYTTPPLKLKEATGLSYILVTPDGERTMNTYLGANEYFSPADIDEKIVAASKIILLEGYLYDRPGAKAAFEKAADVARAHGTKVAFSLSDYRCVERHHEDFVRIFNSGVDIVFANQREIRALTLKDDFNEAVEAVKQMCETIVLTRGAKGATIIHKGTPHHIPPAKAEKLVDTTGAGDAFAAGTLYGLSQGMDPAASGRLGAAAAAKTIAHMGARSPQSRFSDLLPK
jgi:sugar/nucleoside kinase (ribokinase family)